jgi:hypothetical protein
MYEFAEQEEAMMFWDQFQGRWMCGTEFTQPERPDKMSKNEADQGLASLSGEKRLAMTHPARPVRRSVSVPSKRRAGLQLIFCALLLVAMAGLVRASDLIISTATP